MSRDLELAVPGTYDPNHPVVEIEKVQSSMQVITSKQRPRKLSIFGMYFDHVHNIIFSTYKQIKVFEHKC